jgi:DNA-binding transcriptional LysR family regulator
VGKRLIHRAPGHFALTEAGEVLYREALDIQGSIVRLSTLMRDMTDEVTGHVRLSLASHVICPLFDQVLAEFHVENPRATLAIEVHSSAQAIETVSARSASFAICLVHQRNPKLEYMRLYREFFGLFCGPRHALFGQRDLTRADLAGRSAVSFETDRLQDALKPVTLMRAQAELGDQIIATSSHLEEVRRMIIAGLGVGPLPLHVAARDVRDGLLWQLPPYDQTAAVDVHVVWNPRAVLNRAEQSLLDRLLARIDATPIEERTYR